MLQSVLWPYRWFGRWLLSTFILFPKVHDRCQPGDPPITSVFEKTKHMSLFIKLHNCTYIKFVITIAHLTGSQRSSVHAVASEQRPRTCLSHNVKHKASYQTPCPEDAVELYHQAGGGKYAAMMPTAGQGKRSCSKSCRSKASHNAVPNG